MTTDPKSLGTRLLPFLSLALAFAAGALAHAWYASRRPLAPPSLHPFDEFASDSRRDGRHPSRDELTPQRIAELNRRLEVLRPRMDAFRLRLQGIEAGFHQELLGLLTAQQRERLASIELRSSGVEVFPGRPVRAGRARGFPAEILRIIAYRPHLARLSRELGLSEDQRKLLRTLLAERRSKFIALLDDTPPPSMEIGQAFEPDPANGSP